MKKNQFSYRGIVTAIFITSVIICSIACIRPSFTYTDKGKIGDTSAASNPAPGEIAMANDAGENQLIQALLNDRMIDEIKGFTVEKKQSMLYINGKQQSDEIADKYLQSIKQEIIRVQVLPFMQRLQLHPDAGILQLIAPVSFSSPCVAYTPKKPGC